MDFPHHEHVSPESVQPPQTSLPPDEVLHYGVTGHLNSSAPSDVPSAAHNPHATEYEGGPSEDEISGQETDSVPTSTVATEPVTHGIGAVVLDGRRPNDFGAVPEELLKVGQAERFVDLLAEHNGNQHAHDDDIAWLAEGNCDEVVESLPGIPDLPAPDALSTIRDRIEGDPVRIERQVTVEKLREHIAGLNKDGPAEIALDVFGDTAVMRTGGPTSIQHNYEWRPFEKRADVNFHTHPPVEQGIPDQPSLADVRHAYEMGKPTLIGHDGGIISCPPVGMVETLYPIYIQITRRLSDRTEREAYGLRRLYDDFMRDVVKPAYASWDELSPGMTLPEVQRFLNERAAAAHGGRH
jgi:hypothetical protein